MQTAMSDTLARPARRAFAEANFTGVVAAVVSAVGIAFAVFAEAADMSAAARARFPLAD